MKRLVVLAIAAIVLSSCGVTHIVMDKTYHGDRLTLTSNQRAFRYDDGSMKFALGARVPSGAKKDTVLTVLLTYDGDSNDGVFNMDDRIIVTLKDGSEIKLKNIYDKEFEASDEIVESDRYRTDYIMAYSYSPFTDMVYISPIEVTSRVPEFYRVKSSKSYGLYPITKQQLTSIMSKGASRVCVESDLGDVDMPYPENFAPIIKDLYTCLSSNLKAKRK